jgi:hypothetical protein
LGMIRQLEHRVSTLAELRARLDGERHAALREAQRARDTLAAAFKHADALRAAASTVKRIKETIQQHQHPPAQAQRTRSRRHRTCVATRRASRTCQTPSGQQRRSGRTAVPGCSALGRR